MLQLVRRGTVACRGGVCNVNANTEEMQIERHITVCFPIKEFNAPQHVHIVGWGLAHTANPTTGMQIHHAIGHIIGAFH